jgi:hypothetical protein
LFVQNLACVLSSAFWHIRRKLIRISSRILICDRSTSRRLLSLYVTLVGCIACLRRLIDFQCPCYLPSYVVTCGMFGRLLHVSTILRVLCLSWYIVWLIVESILANSQASSACLRLQRSLQLLIYLQAIQLKITLGFGLY